MKKIILVSLFSPILFLITSCAKTVEAPVVITPDTSFSGSTEVEGQDIINQIGKISQEAEGTSEMLQNIQEEEISPMVVPRNPGIRE